MASRPRHSTYLAFLLAVTIFGLAVSTWLLLNPVPLLPKSTSRISLLAVTYGIVCLSGGLAVVFPLTCSGALRTQRPPLGDVKEIRRRASKIGPIVLLHGHHPSGPEATAHELQLGGKSLCATCYGFLTGALVATSTVTAYALRGWPTLSDTRLTYGLFFLGVLCVILSLVQALAWKSGALSRFILAAAFVLGTALMLVATDVVTESLTADLLVILLAVFWLLSRIYLSHQR